MEKISKINVLFLVILLLSSYKTHSRFLKPQLKQNSKEQTNDNIVNFMNSIQYTPITTENKNIPISQVTVIKSTEEGFTGSPKQWFSNAVYNQRHFLNSEGFYNQNDEFFGSYLDFIVHQRMIMDKVTLLFKKILGPN